MNGFKDGTTNVVLVVVVVVVVVVIVVGVRIAVIISLPMKMVIQKNRYRILDVFLFRRNDDGIRTIIVIKVLCEFVCVCVGCGKEYRYEKVEREKEVMIQYNNVMANYHKQQKRMDVVCVGGCEPF